MKINQINTTSCTTTYIVNGIKLRLWIITGGTPALSFEDYDYTQRYKPVEKWSSKHYNHGKYDHQEYNCIQGPTFDVLPNGIEDVKMFIKEHLPKKKLRDKRFDELPFRGELHSRRIHDKDNYCYSYCVLRLKRNSVNMVLVESKYYSSSEDELIYLFPNKWVNLAKIMKKYNNYKWEDLTEKQYNDICEAIKKVL